MNMGDRIKWQEPDHTSTSSQDANVDAFKGHDPVEGADVNE